VRNSSTSSMNGAIICEDAFAAAMDNSQLVNVNTNGLGAAAAAGGTVIGLRHVSSSGGGASGGIGRGGTP
jgi:hypothetical protein